MILHKPKDIPIPEWIHNTYKGHKVRCVYVDGLLFEYDSIFDKLDVSDDVVYYFDHYDEPVKVGDTFVFKHGSYPLFSSDNAQKLLNQCEEDEIKTLMETMFEYKPRESSYWIYIKGDTFEMYDPEKWTIRDGVHQSFNTPPIASKPTPPMAPRKMGPEEQEKTPEKKHYFLNGACFARVSIGLRKYFNLPNYVNWYCSYVINGSESDQQGIKSFDFIQGLSGFKTEKSEYFVTALFQNPNVRHLHIKVLRFEDCEPSKPSEVNISYDFKRKPSCT